MAAVRRPGRRATPRSGSPRPAAPPSPAPTGGTRRRRSAPDRRAAAARPRPRAPPRARPARPDSRASSTTPAMTAARTTDGDAPAATTYATTVASDRRPCTIRRGRPRSAAPTSPATIAMFQPEIATTWLTPAVAKSAASVRSTRSRSPMRIPAARPASGSGSDAPQRVAGGVARRLEREPRASRRPAARAHRGCPPRRSGAGTRRTGHRRAGVAAGRRPRRWRRRVTTG